MGPGGRPALALPHPLNSLDLLPRIFQALNDSVLHGTNSGMLAGNGLAMKCSDNTVTIMQDILFYSKRDLFHGHKEISTRHKEYFT